MRTKWPSPLALMTLGVVALGGSVQCGSTNVQGFAPEQPDAGSEAGFPSFGTSPSNAWSMAFGGSTVRPYAVSASADGTTRIAGALSGLATLGRTQLNSAGGADVLVAKLGPSGEVLWAQNYGDDQDQAASAATVDGDGALLVTGTFAGTLNLTPNEPVILSLGVSPSRGVGPGTSALHARGSTDGFLAKLDSDGRLQWALQLGDPGASVTTAAIALTPDGGVAVTGAYEGSVSFADGNATSMGGTDAFVAAFDASGHPRWSRTFGGTGMDRGTAIAVDPRGDVLVTGNYEGGIDLGTGELQGFGMEDVFVAKLGAGGETQWAKGFGGPDDDDAVAVAFDPGGDVVTLGNYLGDVDLGTGPLPSYTEPEEGWDVYVAKYDANGFPKWAHHYGSIDIVDKGDALLVGPAGEIYVAGHVRSPFLFGPCPVTPSNALFGDAFFGWIDSAGNAQCARTYGYGATTHVRSMAIHPAGGFVMAGDFVGGVDFGQGSLDAVEDTGFAAREEPVPQPLQ